MGEQIKRLREERGMTQSLLAKKLSCEQATISMWERGKRTPDYFSIVALKRALGCSWEELMEA